MNKKELSERDICTKFITPNIVAAGWDVNTQIREEPKIELLFAEILHILLRFLKICV